ncbi:MAG: hypothetical protein O3B21_15825 [Proteobacteria bacterium]|nr:hypothetical protein [Pseudomonadota bacterium]MDA1357367.1 hypothetical protein [Pseudomonadota bacterium]
MTSEHTADYGTRFHDRLYFEPNQQIEGKDFSLEFRPMGLGRPDSLVKAKIFEWDDCLAHPEFDHCYKLCMAKLALEAAITKG